MLPVRKNRSTSFRSRNQRSVTGKAAQLAVETLESRRLLSAGSLDTSFNSTGYILDTLGPTFGANITSIAIDSATGDIIAVGSADGHTAIARYDSSGQPVASFVGDGVITIPIPGHPGAVSAGISDFDFAQSVVIRPDGKIIVSGTMQEGDGNFDIFAMALNADGSLDTSFDDTAVNDAADDGVAVVQGAGDQFAFDSVLSGNTVYVIGSGEDLVDIAKFDTNGPDTSFGTDGLMTVAGLASGVTVKAGVLQPGGKLVVTGGSSSNGFLARIDLGTASLDNTFGPNNDGTVYTPVHVSDDYNDIARDSSGRLLVVGTFIVNGGAPFAEQATQVQRFDADGNLDLTFGGANGAPAGEAEVFPADPNAGYVANTYLPGAMVIDSLGRIVVTGGTRDATGMSEVNSLMTIRFTAAGAPDSDFGTDGVALNAITGNFDGGASVAIQSDGRIVVGGSAQLTDFLTARYIADEPAGNSDPVLDSVTISSPINENGSATLNGSYHDDDLTDTHTLDIDWDGDGIYDVLGLAVSGGSFSFNHQYLDDNPTGTVSDTFDVHVLLHDDTDGEAAGSASLTVNNVAPSVDPISGPASLVRQQTAAFSGSFSDVGTLDTHEVSWDFGDGFVIAYHSSTDAGALSPSHQYTSTGSFTVTLYVKDDDGGISTQTKNVTVVAAAVQGGNLIVGGSNAGETINVTNVLATGQKKVVINGIEVGRFTVPGHVIVNAAGGADTVTIGSNVGGAEVYGGAGNDTINGGNGNDTLDGGSDDDDIDGNAGTDSLIGGQGNDTLNGGADNDTSIGGDGNDVINNAGGDDILDGGIGNDTLNSGAGNDTAIGGDGNDSIQGDAGNDSLLGGNDNDTIDGGGGNDFIDGGAGNDDLNGQGGTDIVLGGADNDTVQGGADRDILIGGAGADSVLGNADEDVLIGSSTSIDSNSSQLQAAQSVWTSGASYASRVASLSSTYFIADVTVLDDHIIDTLTGGAGTDWFIANTDPIAKDIVDNKAGETVTDVD